MNLWFMKENNKERMEKKYLSCQSDILFLMKKRSKIAKELHCMKLCDVKLFLFDIQKINECITYSFNVLNTLQERIDMSQ